MDQKKDNTLSGWENQIVFTGRFFFHTGDKLTVSGDYKLWTNAEPASIKGISDLVYGKGRYIGVGRENTIIVSSDGHN